MTIDSMDFPSSVLHCAHTLSDEFTSWYPCSYEIEWHVLYYSYRAGESIESIPYEKKIFELMESRPTMTQISTVIWRMTFERQETVVLKKILRHEFPFVKWGSRYMIQQSKYEWIGHQFQIHSYALSSLSLSSDLAYSIQMLLYRARARLKLVQFTFIPNHDRATEVTLVVTIAVRFAIEKKVRNASYNRRRQNQNYCRKNKVVEESKSELRNDKERSHSTARHQDMSSDEISKKRRKTRGGSSDEWQYQERQKS